MTSYSDIYFEKSIKLQRLQNIFTVQQNLKSAFPKAHSLFLFNTGWEEQSITKNFFALFFFFLQKHLTHVLYVN